MILFRFNVHQQYISKSKLIPKLDLANLLICAPGVGVKKDFSCLITERMTDLEIIGKSQCFPLYWYESRSEMRSKNKQRSLFDNSESIIRHDGISDHALKLAKSKFGDPVNKEDIFFYIYGYLHSTEYREAFSADLKLALPRIHFVDNFDEFHSFSLAGRNLAEPHLNYENVEPPETLAFTGTKNIDDHLKDPEKCRVDKMILKPDD